MAGHSKWKNIQRRKGAVDAKRGKAFTRLAKEVIVAAKIGGGDPAGNARLRSAIAAAKAENMPKDNIEKAIKKGTGEIEGVNYEECTYEGYGPGGVAILLEVMTDNKNRTLPEVRAAFNKNNGNIGESGSVAWIFERKGLITINASDTTEDDLMEAALDAGAEDIVTEDDTFEVYTDQSAFEDVRQAIEDAGIATLSAEITMRPQNTIKLEAKEAGQMLNLMEKLEDLDDVQKVHANFDISDEVLEAMEV
ncbi:MAG: YebC/PmpR family DNA-binding transcriptional regulator [Proteobacteria bacterium]|nr:YebC/PmpR family DNA-binding transcriptional regulator [Pseudomonadota bacterium]